MATIVFQPDAPEGLAMVAVIEKQVQEHTADEPWAFHYENCRCAYCN